MKTRELLLHTAQIAADYVESVPKGPVQLDSTYTELLAALGGPLPIGGEDDIEVVGQMAQKAGPGLLRSSHPRFYGWVIGGALPAALAADWLVTAWDQNAGAYACSPAAAVVEEVCGGWLKELLGIPTSASYAFVTGCQMAHVTALAAARYRLLANCDWDVGTQGLLGAPRIRVLTGAHHHETFARALRLLGLGTNCIECVGLDDKGRLDPEALRVALQVESVPTLVCAQAGDLNTGVFDPFAEICEIAHQHNAWVHVDGAFGLWANTSPAHAHLLRGIGQADSWATDGHKWLNVPYDSGYVFVKDSEAHRAGMRTEAEYLIEAEGRDQNDWGPEWSRRGRGFATYAAIRSLGKDGIGEMISRCCEVAQRLVDSLGELDGVEVLHAPTINQGLLRFLSEDGDHDRKTDAITRAIQAEGTAWFGPSTWHGMRVMRVSVCNWQSQLSDVPKVVSAVRQILANW